MSKFVLEPCNDVNGKNRFYKLIENTYCHWNEFCQKIEKDATWDEQLDLLKSRMDEVSNGLRMPHNKFHKLRDPIKDSYEVKTDNLRAYVFREKDYYIIIYSGKKTDQTKDLKTFESIKQRYIKAKKDDIQRKTS